MNPPEQIHVQPPGAPFQVFWGGPDRPQRFLRDFLKKRIHGVPSGGEILWVTYYFRDEGLAQALLKASQRGVKVRVVIEGKPRTEAANSRVIELLAAEGALGKNLRVLSHNRLDKQFKRSRLHEKLYYFSHPEPCVLVGTFNPSGNIPEEPAIIRKIGDQDRGHNVLVNIHNPILVNGLYAHAYHIFGSCHGPWERFLPISNRVVKSANTRIVFFPRTKRKDFEELFEGLVSGDRMRIAVSHLNDPGICRRLLRLAYQGIKIEIIAHDTVRRVPAWVEKRMLHYSITFQRYTHPEGWPMHNKFMLIERQEQRIVAFGSMNLSTRSLWANHELLVIDDSRELYQAFEDRWHDLSREITRQVAPSDMTSVAKSERI